MAKKPPARSRARPKAKAPSKAKGRKAKAKKVVFARFVCRDCNSSGKGGYFNADSEKGTKCPYCSSTSVKLLG